MKLVLGGGQHQEGLRGFLYDFQHLWRHLGGGQEAGGELGQDRGQEVSRGGGQVPGQSLQHNHLHVLQLLQAHAAVSGDHKPAEY